MNFKEFFKKCEAVDAPVTNTMIPSINTSGIEQGNTHYPYGDKNLTPITDPVLRANLLGHKEFTSEIISITGPGMQQPGQSTWIGVKPNTVAIIFKNGEKIEMSYHQFKKITIPPEIGRMATVSKLKDGSVNYIQVQ